MSNDIPLLRKLNNYGENGLKEGIRGREIAPLLKGYANLIELIPNISTPAIAEPLSRYRRPLTHEGLRDFIVNDFDLTKFGLSVGSRVAVLLPNGPELAVTVIAVMSKWCAAPLNPTNTKEEIKSELESTRARAIIIQSGASMNTTAIDAARALSIGVIMITPTGAIAGLFHMALLNDVPPSLVTGYTVADTTLGFVSYGHPETVLLLHTSGTSGNKKLVPYSLDMIITGVGCIVSSWNLGPADVCLNMMPLFHIGGILRNALSPILSGGCVIACSGFDPLLFWDILSSPWSASASDQNSGGGPREPVVEGRPLLVTWYYAAPTMHHAILMEAERRPRPLPTGSIRFIANAAGGLLPVLATNLKEAFDAVILTSYGMTECMPISSPPQSYRLDPTGTSGISVGPDVLIVDIDDGAKPLPNGAKGNIMVRGPPCFGGYENNGTANEESFFTINGQPGWFNTGDMGSIDEVGYLFISGRSKEIINRGGETISPFEIEEAVVQFPSIQEVLAFSAPHEQFQETVGVVIVTRAGMPRVDLPTLHSYLDDKLHRSKWPYVMVYSDALPKNAANKLLRIRYAERTNLPTVDEDSSPLSRLYEAVCPKVGTPLSELIKLTPLSQVSSAFDSAAAQNILLQAKLSAGNIRVSKVAVVQVDLPFRPGSFVGFVKLQLDSRDLHSSELHQVEVELQAMCDTKLHRYLVPHFVSVVNDWPVVGSEVWAQLALQVYADRSVVKPRNVIEEQIELVWREQLKAQSTVSVVDSFFDIGGDSIKAGRLINAMRKQLRVQLAVADLFTAPTIEAIAQKVSLLKTLGTPAEKTPSGAEAPRSPRAKGSFGSMQRNGSFAFGAHDLTEDTCSPFASTSFGCLAIQSVPILFLFPIRRIVIWFLVASIWVFGMRHQMGRFHALLVAMFLSRLLMGIIAPLFGVVAKWVIIGKYIPGRYPLWGSMYLRWWLVEQIVHIFGRGIFKEDFPIVGSQLVRFYYELMGAKLGRNVKIHKNADIGQADLLTIGNNVTIDVATIRPFSVEAGYFVLLPITIGDGCSIGVKCQIAAGAVLPSGTCMGPLSSSHELHDSQSRYVDYCRTGFPSPPAYMILLIGCPILLGVTLIGLLPWYFALTVMVHDAQVGNWYVPDVRTVYHAFLWWITPQRLAYYFFIRVVRRCFVPFVRLGLAILVKKCIIGKFEPMSADERLRPWNLMRYWLMSKLLPGGELSDVARLVGTHYEIISVIYRLLGAKIGQRVYWPGSGLDVVEYDLLEVGDDVVFGSRSVVLTSTARRSAKVVFEAGTMVADRCVILPGTVLKRGAVLGSGSLAPEDFVAPVGSVWVGSTAGTAQMVTPADLTYAQKDTRTPFGRAFYDGKASYAVIPLWAIVMYSTTWQAFCTCYRNSPTALSLIMCRFVMKFEHWQYYSPAELFNFTFLAFVPLHLAMCATALGVDIAAKWALLGRRRQGEYPWDKSSYCQRWQLYLTIEDIRRGEQRRAGVLDMIQGSQYLVWYFRALGAKIGANVLLYPNGGDPMMTEPELVTIGDDASIDDASLIAHINTRGIFRLNPLSVGSSCVLKSGTRLLSGASMEAHSMMQEHTLVMSGEMVDEGTLWQGWPCLTQLPIEDHRRRLTACFKEMQAARTFQRAQLRQEEDRALALCCARNCACCADDGDLALLTEVLANDAQRMGTKEGKAAQGSVIYAPLLTSPSAALTKPFAIQPGRSDSETAPLLAMSKSTQLSKKNYSHL